MAENPVDRQWIVTCGLCNGMGVQYGTTCFRCDGTGMKQYILRNGKVMDEDGSTGDVVSMSPELINKVIRVKDFNPLWMFRDCSGTTYKNLYPYWCFLNAHYPEGLVSSDPQQYVDACDALDNGQWLLEQKRTSPDLPIGWGNGASPDKAFEAALRCAGFLKKRETNEVTK